MPDEEISAEVVPVPEKAVQAAKALQKLGFKVFHVGSHSISVRAPESVWSEVFPVRFEARDKRRSAGFESARVSYRRPVPEHVPVPTGLDELIQSIAFAEPPELF